MTKTLPVRVGFMRHSPQYPELGAEVCDRLLLKQFSNQKDERAFETLVQRHAGLVWGVCNRVLQNTHDAEDAFQAVFLVLAKKAGSRGWSDSVGPWLYQTAYRVSLKARSSRNTKQKRSLEYQASHPQETQNSCEDSFDLKSILDRELQRLPETYRQALLLCYLEGKSQDEAAQELGYSVGALRGYLFRGKELLRERLAKYQQALTVAGVSTLLTQTASSASASESLVTTTSHVATSFALGRNVEGAVTVSTLELTQRMLKAMMYAKLKPFAFLFAGVLAIAVGAYFYPANADTPSKVEPPATDKATPLAEKYEDPIGVSGQIKKLDTTKTPAVVTIRLDGNEKVLVAFDIAKDAKILVAGKTTELKNLKEGAEVTLVLGDDHRTVKTVDAVQKRIEGELIKIDGDKLVVKHEEDDDNDKVVTKEIAVSKDAAIYIDDYLSNLKDLEDCKTVTIEYAADEKTVARVRAKWFGMGDMEGEIKTIDATKGEITLTIDGQDGKYDIVVKTNAQSKLYANGKPCTLKDLQLGWEVQLRVEGADKLIGLRAVKSEPKKDDDK